MMQSPLPTSRSLFRHGLGALLVGAALAATPAMADRTVHETHVVRVQAGDADIVEADVTGLAVGESLSLVTESGRMVDILKGADGLEIYLDGELLDLDGAASPEELARRHGALAEERIEIECETQNAGACEEQFTRVVRGDISVGDISVDANRPGAAEGQRVVAVYEKRYEEIYEEVHDGARAEARAEAGGESR